MSIPSFFVQSANEPTTLPLPFPDFPASVLGLMPEVGANEPPGGPTVSPPQLAMPREPRFDFEPSWRGQSNQIESQRSFDQLSSKWREERRRRSLEAILVAQPDHDLPWRPYGAPTARPAVS